MLETCFVTVEAFAAILAIVLVYATVSFHMPTKATGCCEYLAACGASVVLKWYVFISDDEYLSNHIKLTHCRTRSVHKLISNNSGKNDFLHIAQGIPYINVDQNILNSLHLKVFIYILPNFTNHSYNVQSIVKHQNITNTILFLTR